MSAIENSSIGRKSEGRIFDYLKPSTEVRNIGTVVRTPTVTAGEIVPLPATYVGRDAVDDSASKSLGTLVRSLEGFNNSLGRFGYLFQKTQSDIAETKGQMDAMADMGTARKVFQQGLDRATEQGLFPKFAHPKYRLAYMKAAADSITLSDYPSFLEKYRERLTDPNSTEPSSVIFSEARQAFAEQNFKDNPIAQATFLERAFGMEHNESASTRATKEQRFVQNLEDNNSQVTSALTRDFIVASKSGDKTETQLALSNLQQHLDDTRSQYRIDKPNVKFWDDVTASLNYDVSSGTLSPEDALAAIDGIASSLVSGTDLSAKTGDVQDKVANFRSRLVQEAVSLSHRNQTAKTEEEASIGDETDTYIGAIWSKQNRTPTVGDTEEIARAIASSHPSIHPDKIFNIVRNKLRTEANAEAGREGSPEIVSQLSDLASTDPTKAAQLAAMARQTGDITIKDEKTINDAGQKRNAIMEGMASGKYDQRLTEIQDRVEKMFQTEAGFSLGIPADDQAKVAEAKNFAESEYRSMATAAISQIIDEDTDGELRKNPIGFQSVVSKKLADIQQQVINKTAAYIKESELKSIDPNAAPFSPTISSLKQDALTVNQDTSNSTEPDSPVNLARVRLAKRGKEIQQQLARQIPLVSPERQQKLLDAYWETTRALGLSAEEVLAGKTYQGIQIPKEFLTTTSTGTPVWQTTPLFASPREYDALVAPLFSGAPDPQFEENIPQLPSTPNLRRELLNFVTETEGFKGESYTDGGQESIGFGTKAKYKGEVITEREAFSRLQSELTAHAKRIDDAAKKNNVTMSPSQRDALISLDYNTGRGVEVLDKFKGDFQQIANEITTNSSFVRGTNPLTGNKEVLGGLVRRRKDEAAMLLEQQSLTSSQDGVDYLPPVAPPSNKQNKLDEIFKKLGITDPKDQADFLEYQRNLVNRRRFSPL